MNPKRLIAILAIFTIIIQSVMDLNSTHMTNPLWAPHARFHWSIQYFSSILLNMITLFLLYGKYEESGSRLSFIFATLGPLLFWGLFFPSLLMPGTSAWPDGTEPFATIAPNIVMAMVITFLCFLACFWNRRLRMTGKPSSDAGKGFGSHA